MKKSSKRTVKCTICTTHRWKGNMNCKDGRWDIKTLKRKQSANEQLKEFAC